MLCVAIVMAAGVLIAVIAHGALLVRVMAMVLMAVCVLAGSGLVAVGARKIISRAEDQRPAVEDRAHAARDAERG